MTEDTDLIEDEQGGGMVGCPGEYYPELIAIANLLDHPAPKREAARLAMALGIRVGHRTPRSSWGKKKVHPIAHVYGQFDGRGKYDVKLLFELLGLTVADVPLNVLVSEYIATGLKWSRDNRLGEGTHFSQLKESFPDLFPDAPASLESDNPDLENDSADAKAVPEGP
jgi:hypothetical protein